MSIEESSNQTSICRESHYVLGVIGDGEMKRTSLCLLRPYNM